MANSAGHRINWKVSSSIASIVGHWQLNSRDHTRTAGVMEENRDSSGITRQAVWEDFQEESTFTFVRSDPAATGLNYAINQLTTPGTQVTIADANNYNAVTGSNWYVMSHSTSGGNTTSLKETLTLKRWDGIT